jgi:hypothetical protein
MVPPPGSDRLLGIPTRIGAPLSEWISAGEFDSADRCNAAQRESLRKGAQLMSQQKTEDGERLTFAPCIATTTRGSREIRSALYLI